MKKSISILYAVLAALLATTNVLAGGSIKLSGGVNNVDWQLGSLIADATLIGVGKTDLSVILEASGIPVTTCTNPGSNDVPGQSAPKVTALGRQNLFGDDPFRKNGKTPFTVETEDPVLTWSEAGCPNPKWSARVDFVFYTDATLTVKSLAGGEVLFEQDYDCLTTRNPDTVTCWAVPE